MWVMLRHRMVGRMTSTASVVYTEIYVSPSARAKSGWTPANLETIFGTDLFLALSHFQLLNCLSFENLIQQR